MKCKKSKSNVEIKVNWLWKYIGVINYRLNEEGKRPFISIGIGKRIFTPYLYDPYFYGLLATQKREGINHDK